MLPAYAPGIPLLTRIKTICKRYLRVRYIFKTSSFLLLDWVFFIFKRNKAEPDTLLIIHTGAIGDYLLFRNFLEALRNSTRYKNNRITLCGNIIWKSIAEELDHPFIDNFIFIDTKKLGSDWKYRKNILQTIFSKGYETAIYPAYSREYLSGDAIIRCSKATFRIGSASNGSNDFGIFRLFSSTFYTQLINNHDPDFEFDKNELFFDELLQTRLMFQGPFIKLEGKKRSTITFFPGAGEPARQWDPLNFSRVADDLSQKYPHYIIQICGSQHDKKLAGKIIQGCIVAKPNDLTGKTSLPGLLHIIHSTQILLTNESSALHIGACTHTNTIGLLTGKHYKRFSPYPYPWAHGYLHFVYPRPLSFYDDLFARYGAGIFDDVISDLNDIKPEIITGICKQILDENPADR